MFSRCKADFMEITVDVITTPMGAVVARGKGSNCNGMQIALITGSSRNFHRDRCPRYPTV